jgi:hypothetical protein
MSEGHSTNVEYRDLTPLGFPGYRVGSDGSVWSCRKRVGQGGRKGFYFVVGDTWNQMRPGLGSSGYLHLQLAPDLRNYWVHRLVLEAFVGPCPEGMECCHNDGNRQNNSLSNLRWDTRQANQNDRKNHGTHLKGTDVHLAKMNEEQVRTIRTEYATGTTSTNKLARKYNVSQAAIWNIIHRRTWKHV